ncbi:MAG: oxidoreductase [Dehalococcoidia bacterium]|nr:MAG: oxidoreductase [Dehalococcoidia bacterium]
MDLNGKVCLITGASGGIGEAIAYELAKEGASVVLFARRADRLETVAAAIGGERAATVVGDVKNADDIRRAVATAVERFGGLDVLINNAGVSIMGNLHSIPIELVEHGWAVNVIGPILCVQAALPEIEKRGGMIVNISSAMSLRPTKNLAVYSATKAALNVISASLREELRERGVRVLTVHPGFIANEFTRNTLAAPGMEADLQRLTSMPSGRTSEDAARDIVAAMKADAEVYRSLPEMPLTTPL